MHDLKQEVNAIEWTPLGFPGFSMRMLRSTTDSGAALVMTRLNPGASIPVHLQTHADETVDVLQGDFVEDRVTYGPGILFAGRAGTPHGPHASVGGCTVLTTFSATVDFVLL